MFACSSIYLCVVYLFVRLSASNSGLFAVASVHTTIYTFMNAILIGRDYNTVDGRRFRNTSAPLTGAVETTVSQVKIYV